MLYLRHDWSAPAERHLSIRCYVILCRRLGSRNDLSSVSFPFFFSSPLFSPLFLLFFSFFFLFFFSFSFFDEIPPLFITHNENHEADGTIFVTFNEELQCTMHAGYGDQF